MSFYFDPERVAVMGILNVTPDSFSDGGMYTTVDAALARAKEIAAQGADILDIGAQSTRPGHTPVSPEEEWRRLAPVLEAVQGAVPLPISVDTYDPFVAENALQNGAVILNDVSGSLRNGFPALAARYDAGLIAMARDAETPMDVGRQWHAVRRAAKEAGLYDEQLCLDVGIGFHADREVDVAVMRILPRLLADFPQTAVLCGASRKRVIAHCAGDCPAADRLAGTLAFHTVALLRGATVLRVHDVAEAVQAARVTKALL